MKNIYHRRDGRYEGRFSDERTNGTKYFYGRSRAEVERKIADFIASRGNSDCRLTVKMLFDEWLSAVSVKVKPMRTFCRNSAGFLPMSFPPIW